MVPLSSSGSLRLKNLGDRTPDTDAGRDGRQHRHDDDRDDEHAKQRWCRRQRRGVSPDRVVQPDADGNPEDRAGEGGKQLSHDERPPDVVGGGAQSMFDRGGVPRVLHRRPRDEDGVDERQEHESDGEHEH